MCLIQIRRGKLYQFLIFQFAIAWSIYQETSKMKVVNHILIRFNVYQLEFLSNMAVNELTINNDLGYKLAM